MKVKFKWQSPLMKNDWGWGNKQLTAENILSLTVVWNLQHWPEWYDMFSFTSEQVSSQSSHQHCEPSFNMHFRSAVWLWYILSIYRGTGTSRSSWRLIEISTIITVHLFIFISAWLQETWHWWNNLLAVNRMSPDNCNCNLWRVGR